jgi:UDP-glucose 4-epimerase
MATILITGGLGYVGSATTIPLEKQGHKCILVDKKIGVNTLNILKILKIYYKEKPDAIVHLAAKKSVGESLKHPLSYYVNNVGSTLSVALVSALFRVPVVFASSAAIYSPRNPYAKGKLIEERIISNLSRYVILRYFNIGGQMAGVKDEQSANIFSIINSSVINGSTFRVNDARSTRDYVHVKDIGEANLKAVEHLLAGGGSFLTDICSDKQHSVVDILDLYKNNGIKLNIEYSNIPELTIFPTIILGHLLGWEATSTFDDIVKSEIKSVRGIST